MLVSADGGWSRRCTTVGCCHFASSGCLCTLHAAGCRLVTITSNHTPLAQVFDGSTSNNRVQALSVSKRILPSLPAAAQQKTYIDARWSGMRT